MGKKWKKIKENGIKLIRIKSNRAQIQIKSIEH